MTAMEAWLADGHDLTTEQVDQLAATAREIAARYPNSDDQDKRDAALTAAYRLMVEAPGSVVKDLAVELALTRLTELRVLAAIRQCAVTLVVDDSSRGIESAGGFAREVGMDRSSVREWLGKRRR